MNDGNWEQPGVAIVLLPISSVDPRTMLRFLGGVALAAVAVMLAWAEQSQSQPPAGAGSSPAAPILHRTAGEVPVDAEWFDRIFENARRHSEPKPEQPRRRRRDDAPNSGTYRTLCVKLCDGFYFPISYSTLRWRFAADAKQCEQRCPAGARLFVHRNPGEDVDDMVDLDGHPYRSLPTAFLHRARYVANCTCRGNPWDEASLARHRAYAEAARQTVAGKPAAHPPSAHVKPGRGDEQSSASPRIGAGR